MGIYMMSAKTPVEDACIVAMSRLTDSYEYLVTDRLMAKRNALSIQKCKTFIKILECYC